MFLTNFKIKVKPSLSVISKSDEKSQITRFRSYKNKRWTVGGARRFEIKTPNLPLKQMRRSSISVPIFTTIYHIISELPWTNTWKKTRKYFTTDLLCLTSTKNRSPNIKRMAKSFKSLFSSCRVLGFISLSNILSVYRFARCLWHQWRSRTHNGLTWAEMKDEGEWRQRSDSSQKLRKNPNTVPLIKV